eukprot:65214-Rhodomonas_salina.1
MLEQQRLYQRDETAEVQGNRNFQRSDWARWWDRRLYQRDETAAVPGNRNFQRSDWARWWDRQCRWRGW